MTTVNLFTRHPRAVCMKRLAAAVGSPGPTMDSVFAVSTAPFSAFGTVGESSIAIRTQQGRLEAVRLTSVMLRADLRPQGSGTLITGRAEAPDTARLLVTALFLLAFGTFIRTLVLQIEDAMPYGSTGILRLDWEALVESFIFPMATAVWFVLQRGWNRREADRLIAFVADTLDAVPVKNPAVRAAGTGTPSRSSGKGSRVSRQRDHGV